MPKNILPADTYIAINNNELSENYRKILTMLYQPIIGSLPISLYFSLWADLDDDEVASATYSHHHLMITMQEKLDNIVIARQKLEAIGLLKTFVKKGDINSFVYQLYAPITANEFFNHPILNVVLYNNVGRKEYERLVNYFKVPKISTKDYADITATFNEIFSSVPASFLGTVEANFKSSKSNQIELENKLDFAYLMASLPKAIVNDKTFSEDIKKLLEQLSFVYNVNAMSLKNIILDTINEKGLIDKTELRKKIRSYYQFENDNNLPTLVYKNSNESKITTPVNNREKIIKLFETLTPYQFLKSKYNGTTPTARDLRLIESLLVDLQMPQGVVNVLIDYILKINDQKLNKNFVETIAGQWKRMNIKTASEAMQAAEKEHKRVNKNNISKEKKTTSEQPLPVWFDEKIEGESLTNEEEAELKKMLKDYK